MKGFYWAVFLLFFCIQLNWAHEEVKSHSPYIERWSKNLPKENCSYFCRTSLEAWAGPVFIHDQIKAVNIHYRKGMAGGVKLGMWVTATTKIEWEGLYFHSQMAKVKINHLVTHLKGSVVHYATLANFLVRFSYCLKPYLGFGAGYGWERASLRGKTLQTIHENDQRFVYQVMGGIARQFVDQSCRCWSLALDGRCLIFDKHAQAFILSLAGAFEF